MVPSGTDSRILTSMSRIVVSIDIDAPRQRVWDEVAVLERHVDWMADAERIEFLTDSRSGVGTRMEVLTVVGPLRTTDVMEFTEWEPPTRMAIRHQGLVTGVGAFTLTELEGGRTRFTWDEELTFPWYLGNGITATLAKPVLRAIWRRNLTKLRERF